MTTMWNNKTCKGKDCETKATKLCRACGWRYCDDCWNDTDQHPSIDLPRSTEEEVA